jgi:uncharacterized protein YjiS (DUF1127 family)
MAVSIASIMTFSESKFVKGAVRAVINMATTLRHRREIASLANLDDHMLKDIGLARSDIEGALAEPLLSNPSLVLVRCAARHARAERVVSSIRPARPVVPAVTQGTRCA